MILWYLNRVSTHLYRRRHAAHPQPGRHVGQQLCHANGHCDTVTLLRSAPISLVCNNIPTSLARYMPRCRRAGSHACPPYSGVYIFSRCSGLGRSATCLLSNSPPDRFHTRRGSGAGPIRRSRRRSAAGFGQVSLGSSLLRRAATEFWPVFSQAPPLPVLRRMTLSQGRPDAKCAGIILKFLAGRSPVAGPGSRAAPRCRSRRVGCRPAGPIPGGR